jgi:hypothetical protein
MILVGIDTKLDCGINLLLEFGIEIENLKKKKRFELKFRLFR